MGATSSRRLKYRKVLESLDDSYLQPGITTVCVWRDEDDFDRWFKVRNEDETILKVLRFRNKAAPVELQPGVDWMDTAIVYAVLFAPCLDLKDFQVVHKVNLLKNGTTPKKIN